MEGIKTAYGYVKKNGLLTFTTTVVKKSQQDQKMCIFNEPEGERKHREGRDGEKGSERDQG